MGRRTSMQSVAESRFEDGKAASLGMTELLHRRGDVSKGDTARGWRGMQFSRRLRGERGGLAAEDVARRLIRGELGSLRCCLGGGVARGWGWMSAPKYLP
eukprot:gene15306-biopygen2817